MSNLHEIEKYRLKLYGEMLKNDLTQKKKQEKIERQQQLKRDSDQLNKHIQNTKIFDLYKKQELKLLNHSLLEDNMAITSMKRNSSLNHSYAEEGQNFVQSIHQMDSKRLNKLKNDLIQQKNQNKNHISNKRVLQDRIQQIEKMEYQRHENRIKEMQIESVMNYQQIKRKHQQDMELFDKHRRLVQHNQQYRDKIQSFTRGKGMLDRYNRNEYFERKANLLQNQSQIKKQMDEFQKRKHQQSIEYKRKIGDLQNSMLGSILSKAPRYEPKVYNNELKNQMIDDSLKKTQERLQIKKKIEVNNIYGGVHGNQRQKMINIIDKSLGIDKYKTQQRSRSIKRKEIQLEQPIARQNPQNDLTKSELYSSTRNNYKQPQDNENKNLEYSSSHHNINKNEPPLTNRSQYATSELSSSRNKQYYMSYDLITGKNRYYGTE